MAKVGRPSKYDPGYCDEAIEFIGKQGFSKEAFAGYLEISRDTLYEWINKYPEFSDSIKKAEAISLKHWEELGKDMILHGQGNSAVYIFTMKNRFGWVDRTATEYSGKIEHEHNINVLTYGQEDPLLNYLSSQLRSGQFKPAGQNGNGRPTQISSSQLAPEGEKDNLSNKPVD